MAAVPAADRPFVVDPLDGYELLVDEDRKGRLRSLFAQLEAGAPGAALVSAADEFLAVDDTFHPARVLAAQGELAAGNREAAFERLTPAVTELPRYTAAQLLRGRAAEGLGDLVAAAEAYGAIGDVSGLAADRFRDLLPAVEDILGRRLEDAIARQRLDLAEEVLERLSRWSPDSLVTLEGRRALAVATDDPVAELASLIRLQERWPEDRALAERRGDLELEVGDPGRGLAVFESLAGRHPGDPGLAAKVRRAKFRWRFSQLPREVTEIAAKAALDRADHAQLLYWALPAVRYGRGGEARIATDILDHPQREAIARVVNLGLMRVEQSVHRFSPEREVSRAEVFESLLRLVSSKAPQPSCVAGFEASRRPSMAFVCEVATRCGLVPSEADCLPRTGISGSEALDLIRLGSELLGS
ncbi:MAG: hypothetical protein AAF604_08705 [Acidobacteriota bacterium]